MILGFTGTRNGMTAEQKASVAAIIDEYDQAHRESDESLPDVSAVHGDCIGADEDFNTICNGRDINTMCRPCTFENMRANCTDAMSEPKPPMQRNRDIVAQADRMIACPPNFDRIKKGSGTWATIGFAEKANKPLAIVYPDGRVEKRNWE
jgi:hypothetical protein